MTHFAFHSSHWKFSRGFTLIEMLVVFSIMGTLTVVGVLSFFSYNNSQNFQSAVSDVSHALSTTRSRAISQVKPDVCGTSLFQGYQFSFPAGGTATSYQISVLCGGNTYVLSTTNLPQNVTFTTASGITTVFNPGTGITNTVSTFTLSGYGKTSTISIDSNGVISVQ